MEFLKDFIAQYGMMFLYAIITGIAGYIGLQMKRIYEKHINTKEKKAVAKIVVQAVEQMYATASGDEKLNEALTAAREMLAEKGINVTELEMRMLIEAAVAEFNDAFSKNTEVEMTEE